MPCGQERIGHPADKPSIKITPPKEPVGPVRVKPPVGPVKEPVHA